MRRFRKRATSVKMEMPIRTLFLLHRNYTQNIRTEIKTKISMRNSEISTLGQALYQSMGLRRGHEA